MFSRPVFSAINEKISPNLFSYRGASWTTSPTVSTMTKIKPNISATTVKMAIVRASQYGNLDDKLSIQRAKASIMSQIKMAKANGVNRSRVT